MRILRYKGVVLAIALSVLPVIASADAKISGDVEKNVWVEPIKNEKVKVEKIVDKKQPAASTSQAVNILIAKEAKSPTVKTIKLLREALLEAENIKDRDFDYLSFKEEIRNLMQELGTFQ